MAAPKRTKMRRESDLSIIATLELQGFHHAEIAEKMGVSVRQIDYDMEVIRARWKQSAAEAVQSITQRELAKLDALERTYWESWVRSLGQRTISVSERIDLPPILTIDQQGKPLTIQAQRNRARVQTEQRDGNPSFLDGVMKCMERRAKMLGLDAPMTIDITERVRARAIEEGIDPSLAVAAAQRIMDAQKATGSRS